MNYTTTHIITTFNEYVELIKEIKSNNNDKLFWFRGQPSASYTLTPNILRNAKEIKNQFRQDIEPQEVSGNRRGQVVSYPNITKMLNEFKQIAAQYLDITPKNDFEWLFIAQHYGLATPLLDWTTDPLVALFFSLPNDLDKYPTDKISIKNAIENFEYNFYSELGAAIFILDPSRFNEYSEFVYKDDNSSLDKPISIADNYDFFKGYLYPTYEDNHYTPLCVLSKPIDYRICRQSGNFIIHGYNVQPLDDYRVFAELMHKIFIPYGCLHDIKNYLDILDITKTSIYGGQKELEEEGIKIKDKYENEFSLHINKLKEKYNTLKKEN